MHVVRSGSMMQIRDNFASDGDLVWRDLPWIEQFRQEVWEGLSSLNTEMKQRNAGKGVLCGALFQRT